MLIELTVYAADAVASARLLLAHDRLADLLASDDPIDVRSVRLTALDDGHREPLAALDLARDEILVATTGDPRGNPGRRVGTVVRPAVARVGPYTVTGRLHGPPSMDAFEAGRRRAWIPLTDAFVVYRCGGREIRTPSPVALLNGAFVASLVPADADDRLGAGRASTAGWPTGTDTSSAWR